MAWAPRRHSRFWPSLALLIAASPAAAEQLVMPFDCYAPQDGSVRLRPSEPQAYRIYGPRERHVFTVCSPVDDTRCRNWMIHRFDVDCGGIRVSWLEVANAAARLQRSRAWVEGGQMHLEILPLWTADRGRPIRRWWRNRGREEMETVSLPPGYAPTLGLPVQFVADNGARAEHGNAPGADEDGTWEAPAREALPPRSQDLSSRQPPADDKATLPSKARPLEAMPLPEKKPSKAADISADAASSSAKPAEKVPEAAKGDAPKLPDGIVTPTIINGANSGDAPGAGAPQSTPAATAPPPAAAPPPETGKEIASAHETIAPQTSVLDVSGLAAAPSAAPAPERQMAWAGGALAGVLLLSAIYAFSRRTGVASSTWDRQRDLGAVTFEAQANSGTSLVAVGEPALPATLPSERGGGVVSMGAPGDGDIPTSVADALAILGTNADAPTEVIKKIVDGLRQSWHSDLARSEEDRLFRERRMQQVNAAWELVLRSRRAAA